VWLLCAQFFEQFEDKYTTSNFDIRKVKAANNEQRAKMLRQPSKKDENSQTPVCKFSWLWMLTPFVFLIIVVVVLRCAIVLTTTTADDANNIRMSTSEAKFATTVNPHKAGKGDDLGIDLASSVKVINRKSYAALLDKAKAHPRLRKMTDLTKDPEKNGLQVLVNTWYEGSFSPVHMHPTYSEAFIILEGELAFFTFTTDGMPTCHVLSSDGDQAIVVEAGQYHAMTAVPRTMGYTGHAIVFENSGHTYDPKSSTKALASFSSALNDGLDGDPAYYAKILKSCPERTGGTKQ
jgi:cupin fold WbuC family metalloprotein